MTRGAGIRLRALVVPCALLATLLPTATAAGAADPPVARLADAYRYTAVGDPAVFTYVQAGGDGVDDERVVLRDRRGRVTSAALEPTSDGVRVAELRTSALPPGVHRLKACSASACAITVHIVYDGVVDGVVAALLGRRSTALERSRLAGRPIADVVEVVAASPERLAGIVRELYHFHLGRPPELAGLVHWILFLRAGGSAVDLAIALCGAEPRALPGRPPGRCWPGVDFLGPFGDIEVDGSPAEVATSEEARSWVVTRVFEALLDRVPDASAITHWTATVPGPVTSDALLVGVLGSDEYTDQRG